MQTTPIFIGFGLMYSAQTGKWDAPTRVAFERKADAENWLLFNRNWMLKGRVFDAVTYPYSFGC